MNEKVLTVAQVNHYIKDLFDGDFILRRLFVQGEISNCKLHSSGHIYFTLKDSLSAISCVFFKGNQQGSLLRLRDGMRVIVNGSASVYEKTGQYQIYVKEVIEDGIGFLYQKFEQLKEQLTELGWFDPSMKKKLPIYPRKVGIVTSETGAVIQDITNVAKRRNPYIQLILYPSLVQGNEAKHHITKGIQYFNDVEKVDVIIVGRGGGSLEDLWPFNEELVATAIHDSVVPIVSAVGHETDFTIADFVSDLRAPTPSAAAEIVIPSIFELDEMVRNYQISLLHKLRYKIMGFKNRNQILSAKLSLYHPNRILNQKILHLSELQSRLELRMTLKLQEKKHELGVLHEKLKGLSVIKRLESGYALVMDESGKRIKGIDQVNLKQNLQIIMMDGQIEAKVQNITPEKREANEKRENL